MFQGVRGCSRLIEHENAGVDAVDALTSVLENAVAETVAELWDEFLPG